MSKFVPAFAAPKAPAESRAWFVVHPKGLLVHEAEGAGITLPNDADIAALAIDRATAHHLGTLDDKDALAVSYAGAVEAPFTVMGLRILAGELDDTTFGVAGRALHVIDWASTSKYCGRCGAATESVANERSMKCPQCALVIYPRISPAIIVLVRRGDEALLARSARFPVAFYSTLAGFSEIGESLEQTLAREVFEEVSVHVKNIRYFGSQPWPFPNSLMLGFMAEWESGEIHVDGEEILDAKWFKHDALPNVPPPLSIARRLIDSWVNEVSTKGKTA